MSSGPRSQRSVKKPESATESTLRAPPRKSVPTREDLIALLEKSDWDVEPIAEYFCKDRHQIHQWARQYGIDIAGQLKKKGGKA